MIRHVSGTYTYTYTRLSVTTFYIDIPYITNRFPILDIGKYSTLHYTLTIQPTTTESRDIRKAPALGFLPDIHMSSTLLGSVLNPVRFLPSRSQHVNSVRALLLYSCDDYMEACHTRGRRGREAPYAPTVPLNWCVTITTITIKISRRTEYFCLQRHNFNCACAY